MPEPQKSDEKSVFYKFALQQHVVMTVLKTLRICRIFSHFGKMSAAWSDSRLLVVVLIGSAVMLVLSIVTSSMTSLDDTDPAIPLKTSKFPENA